MKVSFEEVINSFYENHKHDENESNIYAERCIKEANDKFKGQWEYRPLTADEYLNTVLPKHSHFQENNGVVLVPPQGLTLEQAIKRLKSLKDYPRTNSKCWSTIQYLKDSRSPVYLSHTPLEVEDYKLLKILNGGHLYHIDGLHRLLARGLQNNNREKGLAIAPIYAYIAGVQGLTP